MEELLSTGNIRREILDDANRKAEKTLKNADALVAAAFAEWDQKLRKAVDEVKERYLAEVAEKKAEAEARLAMDKARAELSKITGELQNAMYAFVHSLERKELLAILENALAKRIANVKAAFAGSPHPPDFSHLHVETAGLTQTETETTLSRLSLAASRIDERAGADDSSPSIVVTAGDIKITASIQAEADAMLLSKRSELAEALFG
jgi:type I restriction-modification system DNA methylase subunit